MTDVRPASEARAARGAPGVVAPTNRINVAFPLSKITVQEPSKELRELAGLVADLASLLEAVTAGPQLDELRARAEALAGRTG